jgi:hypothetical protein
MHARRICQDSIRASGDGIDDVLAAVAHEKHLAVAQIACLWNAPPDRSPLL